MSKMDIFLLEFIDSENQLADIFTKSFLEERFCFLRKSLCIIVLTNYNLHMLNIIRVSTFSVH